MSALLKEKAISSKNSAAVDSLRQQIKSRIEAMDISIRSLERKAGLNIGAINNIISGASANPTTETLMALATALDCSIDELLGRDIKSNSAPADALEGFKPFKWNHNLFTSISNELDTQLANRKLSISSKQALSIIQDVYLYSLKKNKEQVEESLVEWLIDKTL